MWLCFLFCQYNHPLLNTGFMWYVCADYVICVWAASEGLEVRALSKCASQGSQAQQFVAQCKLWPEDLWFWAGQGGGWHRRRACPDSNRAAHDRVCCHTLVQVKFTFLLLIDIAHVACVQAHTPIEREIDKSLLNLVGDHIWSIQRGWDLNTRHAKHKLTNLGDKEVGWFFIITHTHTHTPLLLLIYLFLVDLLECPALDHIRGHFCNLFHESHLLHTFIS